MTVSFQFRNFFQDFPSNLSTPNVSTLPNVNSSNSSNLPDLLSRICFGFSPLLERTLEAASDNKTATVARCASSLENDAFCEDLRVCAAALEGEERVQDVCPPGGGLDGLIRCLARELGRSQGWPFLFLNRNVY